MRIVIFIAFFIIQLPIAASSGTTNPGSEDTFSLNAYVKREVIVDENDDDNDDLPAVESPWSKFEKGPASSMAVLITNPNCSWLALSHGLKTIGIPFIITTDYKVAAEHKSILIYPELNSISAELSNLLLLREFVLKGGYLVGMNVEGIALQDIFGYTSTDYADNVSSITFKKLKYSFEELTFKKDPIVDIRSLKVYLKHIKYIEPLLKPLATYDDGSASIIENVFGKGKSMSIGCDLGAYLSKGYNGRIAAITSSEANQYKPDLDVFLRLIREFYRESGGIALSTCQHGKNLTVILTHDIDAPNSINNSFAYATFEKEKNISSTYFIQTKYVKDWDVEGFYTESNVSLLKELKGMNVEIGSHSVSNARTFQSFDPGDCEETINNYKPVLETEMLTRDATVSGEIMVSKQILDSTLGNKTLSFRPGFYSYPRSLPQALAAGGYNCSSSMTANDALTHYPFQLSYNREDIKDVPVFEIPVTIEDQKWKLDDRFTDAIEIANHISKQQGVMVVSINPNTPDKLDFEKKFVKEEFEKAVFSSMKDFSSFWSARNDISIEVVGNKIIIDSPKLIEGLTLLLPNGKTQILPFFKDHLEVTY